MVNLLEVLRELEAKEMGPVEPYPSQAERLKEAEAKHRALVPMELKGRRSLLRKYSEMRPNYSASEAQAVTNYNNLPFGPKTKQAFKESWRYNPENYNKKIIVSHEKKWATNWMEGVSK